MGKPRKDCFTPDKLKTKTPRAALGARRKPYYFNLARGRSLGYSRESERFAGRWLSRERVGQSYRERRLGQADDFSRADGRTVLTFEQAAQMALAVNPAPAAGKLTVEDAFQPYLARIRAKSPRLAKVYEDWAKLRILSDLGARPIRDLTKTGLEKWFAGLIPARCKDDEDRRKKQSTANRILTILKAALNHAYSDEANGIATDSAWRRVKPFEGVDAGRREDFSPADVRSLIAKAALFDRNFADLVEVGFLTGARFGELAAATVRDFDADAGTLRVYTITSKQKKARTVSLTDETVAVLKRLTADKLPLAPILPRGDGKAWQGTQHRPMQKALKAAELSTAASFNTLRHAHISRAIEGQMPLSLIAENCGTSLQMIQRNYAHVLASTRRETIQQTAPKLRVIASS